MGDRIPPGRVDHPVSTRDLSATVLDLIGLDAGASMPGASLRDFWTGPDPKPAVNPTLASVTGIEGKSAAQPISRGDMLALVTDSLLVIRDGTCALEVFDIEDDPLSVRALPGSAVAPILSLARQLDSLAPAVDCD